MSRGAHVAVLLALAGCDGASSNGDASAADLAPLLDLNPCTASCCDGVKDGDESDVDCGGSCPTACVPGRACAVARDCTSGVCSAGRCAAPRCSDGVQNGSETDVDCGGGCAPCASGRHCKKQGDCLGVGCVNGTCAQPACNDGVRNGTETDVDCGRGCPPCPNGELCVDDGDCQSALCNLQTLRCVATTCLDGVLDGAETDLDCGGPDCTPCADGAICQSGTDCLSGSCQAGHCSSTCADGVVDGTETDVDCGGPDCPGCADGRACSAPGDCQSKICGSATFRCGGCFDGVKDGQEGDVDCGGQCPRCANGKTCGSDLDCQGRYCASGSCADSCTDGMSDGDESDVDCGGAACPPCAIGLRCGDVNGNHGARPDQDCAGGGTTTVCLLEFDTVACGFVYQGYCTARCSGPQDCKNDCCDPDAHVCGKPWAGGFCTFSNCGVAGDTCVHCIIDEPAPVFQSCEQGKTGAYCADNCAKVNCTTCCQVRFGQQYCLHGDEDSACGAGGGACAVCPAGQRCVNQACVAVGDGGAPVDGGAD